MVQNGETLELLKVRDRFVVFGLRANDDIRYELTVPFTAIAARVLGSPLERVD